MGKKKGAKAGGDDPGKVSTAFDVEWLDAGPGRARSFVDRAEERGADLVEAWVARKNAAAVLEIAADDGAPTSARKAARRGINVLKSRGVAIPERTRVAGVIPEEEVFEAWFRPPDGAGTSAFTLGSRSQGRYRLVDVIMKRGVGLVSIAAMQMSRSQLRTTFDGIAQRFGSAPAPVPMAWARARIASARLQNEASGTPIPLGYDSHRELLGEGAGAPPPHPARDSNLPPVETREALDRSATLHSEPELRGWLPDPPAIQQMLLAISQSIRAEVASERGATQAKVREVIEKATDEYFVPQARADMAERMLDAVISMAARGAGDRAADLLATSDAVRALEQGVLPHTIPFLRGFFEKAFGLATARAAAQKRG